jgi:hypothetical protein
LLQLSGDFFENIGFQQTLTDGRLVRDDNHREPQGGELFDRLSDTRHKDELGPVQYVVVRPSAIYYAIAVDEERGSP